jgi:inner membrane protein
MPDVDTPGSIIGRRVRLVSVLLEALAGHRTICHTVWFCLLVAAGFAALGSWAAGFVPGASALWGLPALAGALSHLLLDAATKSGVEPFAPLPLPGRLAFLAHPHGPLKTGTWWQEIPAMLGFAALALAALKF